MKNFSLKFWQSFINVNNDFSTACVVKNAINFNMLNKLNIGVMEVLKNRLTMKDIDNGFRVYIDGIEQEDDYLNNLCSTPPREEENITTYTNRIFEKKFGLIINGGERHSDLISNNIISAIQPLLELKGMPPLGLEITIFIGNYGWTPLGIHQDHCGENVIHFHLGPGNKKMYIWDEDKYKELSDNKQNNTNIFPILPYAKEFEFGTGDIYYMPWNLFHIGRTDELSVGITLWFNNPSKYKYLNKILESFVIQFAKKETDVIDNKFNLIENSQTSSKDIFDILDINSEILKDSVEFFFNFLTEEFNYNLISNGGWQTKPLSRKEKNNFDVDSDYKIFIDKQIKSNNHFKILYKINNDMLFVYTRGSKFQMKYFTDLIDVINELNKFEVINLNEYFSTKKINIPKDAILYFLGLLYDKRGFEIINN